jgi:hypothetical protein
MFSGKGLHSDAYGPEIVGTHCTAAALAGLSQFRQHQHQQKAKDGDDRKELPQWETGTSMSHSRRTVSVFTGHNYTSAAASSICQHASSTRHGDPDVV